MEIKIIDSTKNRITFDLIGEDHTFCGALKQELWNDKDVKIASYKIDHPLINIPQFLVETKGKDPKKALADAVKRLNKDLDKFAKAF